MINHSTAVVIEVIMGITEVFIFLITSKIAASGNKKMLVKRER